MELKVQLLRSNLAHSYRLVDTTTVLGDAELKYS